MVTTELTHKSAQDFQVLTYMARKICVTLHSIEQATLTPPPFSFTLQGRHRRIQHITILDAQRELSTKPLTFVGFIGDKRDQIDPTVRADLFAADAQITAELVNMPGFLYYSSLELRPDHWYNLVVLSHADARAHLRNSPAHRLAAYQLAPGYYQSIRLHHGTMPAGLSGPLLSHKTRHFTAHDNAQNFTVHESSYSSSTTVSTLA